MHRKTITITEQMEDWVKAQIQSGQYGNDSEYFRDLIRRDQGRKMAEAELRSMLEDAETSGLSKRSPQQIWDAAQAQYKTKHA